VHAKHDGLADNALNPVKVKRGQHLTYEGKTGLRAFVIQAGWACNYKLLRLSLPGQNSDE